MSVYLSLRIEHEGKAKGGWKSGRQQHDALDALCDRLKVPRFDKFTGGGGPDGPVGGMLSPIVDDVLEKEHNGEISSRESIRRLEAIYDLHNWLGRWFPARDGLKTVRGLIKYFESHGDEEGLLRELRLMEKALSAAHKKKRRFRVEYG